MYKGISNLILLILFLFGGYFLYVTTDPIIVVIYVACVIGYVNRPSKEVD